MKDITKIRLNNLKDAEYMIISITENSGLYVERHNHSFTDMLDIMMTDSNIDEAAEYLDIPVMGEITVDDNLRIDPEIQDVKEYPMLIIRVK